MTSQPRPKPHTSHPLRKEGFDQYDCFSYGHISSASGRFDRVILPPRLVEQFLHEPRLLL